MAWTPRSRDAYRIAITTATGLIVSGSLAGTGALAAVAANETAWQEYRKQYPSADRPVIVVVKQRPTKVVPKYVTKPGAGGTITAPQSSTTTVVRVVRKPTKSSGS